MKRSFLPLFFAMMLARLASGQDIKFPAVDKSPADIVYYPLNIAKDKDLSKKPLIKITYSRPSKNGRPVFGVLERFGKVWRTGANESTEIKFYKNVKFGDKKVKAGVYSLLTIPDRDKWTIIINRQTDKWGAYTYDQSKDIVRVDVPVRVSSTVIEQFSITFGEHPKGANIIMGWDQTIVEVPVLTGKG